MSSSSKQIKEMESGTLELMDSKFSGGVLDIKTHLLFIFDSPTQVELRLQRLQASGLTPLSSLFPIVPYL